MPRRSMPPGLQYQQEYEVEKIINHKFDQQFNTFIYLVFWKGYTENDNSWEPEKNLINSQEILNAYKLRHKARMDRDQNPNQIEEMEIDTTGERDTDYFPTKTAEKQEQKKKNPSRKSQNLTLSQRGSKKRSQQESDESENGEGQAKPLEEEVTQDAKLTRFQSKGKEKYAIKRHTKNERGVWMFEFQLQNLGYAQNMCRDLKQTLELIDPVQIIHYLLNKSEKEQQQQQQQQQQQNCLNNII